MFYSNYGSISCRFWDIQCRKMSRHWNWGQRSLKVIESGTIRYIAYGFLLVFFSNFVRKTQFLRYSTCKYTVTLKPGLGSRKVIKNYTIRSGTHDFLLTFHSNHRSILHRFWDKHVKNHRFFPTRVFCAPSEWVTLGIVYRRRGQKKLEWLGYQLVKKVLR